MLQNNIDKIHFDDERYPPLLRQISQPPKDLYVRGILKDQPCVSIVGTRRSTPYGKRAVRELVHGLASAGFGVVSGLALGIDGEAHRAALEVGAYTIAVLGTGIDDASIYPREHLGLAREIIKQNGTLISEANPGGRSFKYVFPRRNRIIAGLTTATIVIEANEKSGSLITARLAMEENREVLAVPGNIWSQVSTGCHKLIKLGAKICTNAQDVLDAMHFDQPELINNARASLPLTANDRLVLEALTEPTHIDDLCVKIQQNAPIVSASLSLLEIKGYVAQLSGQTWIQTHTKLQK